MEPFRFKQFTVHHERSAMKIGTDGILLGAWADVGADTESILDVGAGTGLIALMLAQRSQAGLIDAVEQAPDAYEECVENFERSPWNDRLFCYHASLQDFAAEMDEAYQLIVCNPPFHPSGVRAADGNRHRARSGEHLPTDTLIACCASLLSPDGELALVYPAGGEAKVLARAKEQGLFPRRICRVRGKDQGPFVRTLFQLGRSNTDAEITELSLRDASGTYSSEFRELTSDFYLKK